MLAVQGPATYASVMPHVMTLRIVHNTAPDPRGALVNSALNIDNVEALPEPSGAAGLGASALWLAALDRLRRRRCAVLRSAGSG